MSSGGNFHTPIVSIIAGGNKGLSDGNGREAKFRYPLRLLHGMTQDFNALAILCDSVDNGYSVDVIRR